MTTDSALFETVSTPHGELVRIYARGQEVLGHPMLNRGTAFTHDERRALGLNGLLPSHVVDLEGQLRRVYEQYEKQPDDLAKYVFLTALRDRNETLFYRTLTEHIEEMMPVVYTPTIGEAIQKFSHYFHRPRGVFLSIDDPDGIEQAFLNYGIDGDQVDLIVATDSEGILGIGDQGVGGINIAIGKLAIYTAAAGIHPRRVIPVVLDVGTDNLEMLADEAYLGERHARVRGERYDAFITKYVEVASRLFPHALLHWEDFGASNAHRILDRFRDEVCTFNDDIQGTAAVVAAAALSAVQAKGERMSDQTIVLHGAGTAGVGIADLLCDIMVREGLSREEARKRCYCLASRGLITELLGDKVRDFQKPYARTAAEVEHWNAPRKGRFDLADVIGNVHPTVLIGTSGQPGSFTRPVITEMAAHTARPIIMPLSNPTSLAEAIPADLLEWTDGRAMIATGSPFAPVTYKGVRYEIAQANNALVFPGLGLGVAACQATRVTDGMIAASAEAVAGFARVGKLGDALLPSIRQLRTVSARVATAVAQAAHEEGVAAAWPENIIQAVYDRMWQPRYPRLEVSEPSARAKARAAKAEVTKVATTKAEAAKS